MPRRFNTAGPCLFEDHYMLSPEERLPQVRALIDGKHFFVIHAPRQVGKTTLMRNLSRTLTAEGKYAALTISLESFMEGGPETVMPQLLRKLSWESEYFLPAELQPPAVEKFTGDPLVVFQGYLSAWSAAIDRPLVLFLDEADSVTGPVLLSLLRQLRDGYTARPRPFPRSVALIGLEDVRDYKIQVRPDRETLGTASPFNIKVRSLSMGYFTAAETAALLRQHQKETGQVFTDEAIREILHQSGGQPWLVNALAAQSTTDYDALVQDRTIPVQRTHVLAAREILIERRDTHLDSLVSRLREPRIQRVIEPILTGDATAGDTVYDEDFAYLQNLGLVTVEDGTRRIANPIYAEIIARVLINFVEACIPEPPECAGEDGTLDMMGLIEGFVEFWRENGEIVLRGISYQEAAPHLVFMGYLQRIVDGGRVDREFALGTQRADLVIHYGKTQKEVIELKLIQAPKAVERGLRQVSEYARRLGRDKGYLILFDREATTPWEERGEVEEMETGGVTVVVVRV
uniref:AAA-like domain-containing protein n=1 Tax=Candidatus Kentrum sp. LFY TaxID=2126342 RepID=A0A450V739_9GAMM|nr:MAG: AAA-like domain-containing protein [Candidatus Kentron sp. LFY]